MATISELKSAIKSGIIRKHKWRVYFDFPTYAGSSSDSSQASILARTTSTPSANIGVIELAWGGRVLPLPGDRKYDEFTVTFIGVNDQNVYNALQKWSENINGSETNTGLSALDDFMRDITMNLLDSNDATTQTFILKDAWPAHVGQMSLDSGELDTYTEFEVTFRYVNYEIPNVTN